MLSSSAAVRSRAAHQTASSSVRLGPYRCSYGSIKPLFKPTTSKPLQRAAPGPLCLRPGGRAWLRARVSSSEEHSEQMWPRLKFVPSNIQSLDHFCCGGVWKCKGGRVLASKSGPARFQNVINEVPCGSSEISVGALHFELESALVSSRTAA